MKILIPILILFLFGCGAKKIKIPNLCADQSVLKDFIENPDKYDFGPIKSRPERGKDKIIFFKDFELEWTIQFIESDNTIEINRKYYHLKDISRGRDKYIIELEPKEQR